MLKLQSSSSRVHCLTRATLSRRVKQDSNSVFHALGQLTGLAQRSPTNSLFRAFFCSDASDGSGSGSGSEPVVEVEVNGVESECNGSESIASSVIVPTYPRPEDYLTILALPLLHRPLFPGFYMPIYVKDPKLLAASQESRKRQAPYAGAFVLKDEPVTESSPSSETEKSVYDIKGKELFNCLHEVGTLSQVSEDPLTVKVDHLKEKPYNKDDDVIKATSFEVISTLKAVLKTSSLWRDHVQMYSQSRVSLMHPRCNLFHGKFRLGNNFPVSGNKHAFRQLSSDNTPSQTVTELISKQCWKQLKTRLENASPSAFLQQLLDSKIDPDLTLRYFKWSEKEFYLTHSLELRCKVLHSLANAQRYRKMRSFLHCFVKNENSISVHSIFHAISICGDSFCVKSIIADMLVLAYVENMKTRLGFEAFKRAGDYGFKLSVISCNPLLSALVKENEIGDMEYVYKEMIRRRIEFNVIGFNIVINGLCKVGKLNKASDVVQDMKAWGALPNLITYNTLIAGYCKKGRIGKMYKVDAILKEMNASEVRRNEITFNILIDGFCKDENLSAAMKMFEEMQTQGLKPNVVSYNSLINRLCLEGRLDDAICLQNEMVGSGLRPNVVTYNVLINGFCKKGKMKEATDLLHDIVKNGIAPTVITYNTLINAYCEDGKMEDAFALCESMLDRGIFPNVTTYNCLISGLCREGNIPVIRKLINVMIDKGLKVDVVTYNILVDALCKKGESRKAARVLDEMVKIGLRPNHVTYNTLMDGYCREGNLRAALNVRTQMEKEGRRANVVTYNVLIKGLCKKGKLEDANGLLNEMLEKGLIPNRTTYEIVKEEMVEKGFVPDIEGHLYSISGS